MMLKNCAPGAKWVEFTIDHETKTVRFKRHGNKVLLTFNEFEQANAHYREQLTAD
ncbi:hypothetical protein GSI01S_29_00070 [Gordonia sihwensis NBRC 108236]|uniref:Uncharacterized protein n=1 Tax=Gordonia sihwensis NBRC 108236 TaxID=1223544 RepID=L7LML9_9ACTN|nr:hypothetical protein GSI01S_29_00070 [Gordonia sihwensis NBRC 108236]